MAVITLFNDGDGADIVRGVINTNATNLNNQLDTHETTLNNIGNENVPNGYMSMDATGTADGTLVSTGSETEKGVYKVGNNLSVDASDFLNVDLPIATNTILGAVTATTKTAETQEVVVDSAGKLFTEEGTSKRVVAVRTANLVISSETELSFEQNNSINTSDIFVNNNNEIEFADDGFYIGMLEVYADESSDPIFNCWAEKWDSQLAIPQWVLLSRSLMQIRTRDDAGLSFSFNRGGNFVSGDKIRLKGRTTSGTVTLKTITRSTSLGTVAQDAMVLTMWRIGDVT